MEFKQWTEDIPSFFSKRDDIRNLEFIEETVQKLWIKLRSAIQQYVDEEGAEPACTGVPDSFFPEGPYGHHPVKTASAVYICKNCPLVDMCSTYSILANEEYGIWGGLLPNERRSIRREINNERKAAALISYGYSFYRKARLQANRR